MRRLIIFQFFISCFAFGQTQRNDSIYYKPEIAAKFKYGDQEIINFITTNLVLPHSAMYYGINGVVDLTVIIDTVGKFKNILINKETDDPGALLNSYEVSIKNQEKELKGLFSDEAKRVVMLLSGLYESATNSGVHVQSALTLTISFSTLQYKKNQRDYQKQIRKKNIYWTFGEYESEYNKGSDTLRFNKGVQVLTDKKYDLACIYFEEAIKLNSKYIDAYYDLGISYLKLNDITRACEAWKKTQELGDTEVQTLISKYCN